MFFYNFIGAIFFTQRPVNKSRFPTVLGVRSVYPPLASPRPVRTMESKTEYKSRTKNVIFCLNFPLFFKEVESAEFIGTVSTLHGLEGPLYLSENSFT